MTEYTLVLEIGQSNASPVGDIQGWEDAHPDYAIRSPGIARNRALQFSGGSYRDDYTLAATFKGGPQIGTSGLTLNGTWQTVNLRGVAADAVRVATFYNPSGLGFHNSGASVQSWPGTYSVAESTTNTGEKFKTNFRVQKGDVFATTTTFAGDTVTFGSAHSFVVGDIVLFETVASPITSAGPYYVTSVGGATSVDLALWPQGSALNVTGSATLVLRKVGSLTQKLTRKRTGSTHAYAPSSIGLTNTDAELIVDPPFTPAPAAREEFTVDMRLQAPASSSSGPLVFESLFGGYVNTKDALASTDNVELRSTSSGEQVIHGRTILLRQDRAYTGPSGTYYPIRQFEFAVPASASESQPTNNVVTVTPAQDFCVGESIRVSGSSGALAAGTYTISALGNNGTQLTLTGVSTITWGQNDAPVLERLDAPMMWVVSAEQGGAAASSAVAPTLATYAEESRFAGSLAGLRIRCLTGANVGQWKHGTHFDLSSNVVRAHYDGAWSVVPERGDTFVIEPTPVGDEERPFEKFCQLLPWAPWEGLARGSKVGGPQQVSITLANGSVQVNGLYAPRGTSIKLYRKNAGTDLPFGLLAGQTYYSRSVNGTSCVLAATYGGAAVTGTGSPPATNEFYAETVDNDLGYNPFPPGFNYPNQFAMPRLYMPFDGYLTGAFYNEETKQEGAGVSPGMQLSFALHDYTGRRSLLVPLPFSATSLAHKEVHPTGVVNNEIFGWSDLNQQISWAPGEDNGCFARLLDVLDGVKLALTEEGSTVKDTVVFFNQGEDDAGSDYRSSHYRQNLKRFKAAVRTALVDRGLAPSNADRVKWVQNTIRESLPWVYAETVNDAIEAEALSDFYSRSIVGSDLKVFAEQPELAGALGDPLHYYGTQMDLLGQRAFAAFKALERSGYTETEVCNMALSYLGEPGRLTNVDTDTSREAELCRQFLALARDELLERHAWDFALRSVKPTKRSASPRVDYKFAYDYPENVASVLALVRSDVDYNYKTMGTTGHHDYAVELDENGDRVLLTDLDDALMLYVGKVTDPTKWSTVFTTALAWRLVFHIAGAILKGEEGSKKAVAAAQMAEAAMRTATKHDGDHKRDVNISDHVPVWLRHRSNPGHYRR